MDSIVIIPARMASARYPGKPLIKIQGKSLLYRCYQNVLKASRVSAVYIATPDQEIVDEVKSWPDSPECILTSRTCRNGTERVAEAIRLENIPENTVVVNCQGDQYGFTSGDFIEGPVRMVQEQKGDFVATVVCPLDPRAVGKRNVVKVVLKSTPSSTLISQFAREIPFSYSFQVYQHVGVYAARAREFLAYTKMPVSLDEEQQSLEQLRWMKAGVPIGAYYIQKIPRTIDVPENIYV